MILDGGSSGRIKVKHHRYCRRMGRQDADRLRAIFGEVQFEQYFRVRTSLTIDVEKLTDVQADRIMEALGESAVDVLTAESVVVPTDLYLRDRVLNRGIQKQVQEAEAQGLAFPGAATFRLVT